LAFVEWFRSPKRKPTALHEVLGGSQNVHMRDEISILELAPDGIFYWSGWGYREEILADNYAVGSGGMAALAALRSGKNLEEAVATAIGIDEYTGCEIQVMYLNDPAYKKKRGG
jgi:ATP-dependent protease HslVU (ClpYQ) peptidase subunit